MHDLKNEACVTNSCSGPEKRIRCPRIHPVDFKFDMTRSKFRRAIRKSTTPSPNSKQLVRKICRSFACSAGCQKLISTSGATTRSSRCTERGGKAKRRRCGGVEGLLLMPRGVIVRSAAPQSGTLPLRAAVKHEYPFCDRIASSESMAANDIAVAFPDGFPVSDGHTLIVPRRHVTSPWDLSAGERQAITAARISIQSMGCGGGEIIH